MVEGRLSTLAGERCVLEGRSSTLAGKRVYQAENYIPGSRYQRWRVNRWALEEKGGVPAGIPSTLAGVSNDLLVSADDVQDVITPDFLYRILEKTDLFQLLERFLYGRVLRPFMGCQL